MKLTKLLRGSVLASLGTVLVACGGGVSTLGSGDEPVGKAGTTSTSTGGSAGEMLPGMGGSTSTAGKNGIAGMGAAPHGEPCMIDSDCPNYGAPCEPCADGSYACNRAYCSAGQCVHTGDQCSSMCATDMDCPVVDVACRTCADGTQSCETASCQSGTCKSSSPGCPEDDRCAGLECGDACKPCGPDGMNCTDAPTYCDAKGACLVGVPQCLGPGECKNAMDCGTPPPECKLCPDGTCSAFDCLNGMCVFGCGTGPEPEPECKTVKDCPVIGDQCTQCPNSMKCAVQACLSDKCQLVCPVQ